MKRCHPWASRFCTWHRIRRQSCNQLERCIPLFFVLPLPSLLPSVPLPPIPLSCRHHCSYEPSGRVQGGVGIGSVQQWQAGESGSRESGSREWCERQLVLVSATVPRSVTETAAKWGWEPLVLVEGGGRAGVQEEQGERGLVAAVKGIWEDRGRGMNTSGLRPNHVIWCTAHS